MQNFEKVSNNELWSPYLILNGIVNATDNIDNKLNYKTYISQNNENVNNITSRNYSENCVSNLFFSQFNIDILQEGLRNMILNKTDGKFNINKQSETELKIIMRSIYLQFSKNSSNDITTQVKELNKLVLEWAVPEIISNIKQHENYKQDISTLPIPIERAQLTSQKGTRVLELKSFM
jgi:hypothetical protein